LGGGIVTHASSIGATIFNTMLCHPLFHGHRASLTLTGSFFLDFLL